MLRVASQCTPWQRSTSYHTVPSASAHTASRRQICRDLLHWQTRKRREIVLLGMCACPGTGNLDKPTCPSTSLPQSSLPVIMQFSRVHTCRAHVSIVCSFTVPSVLLLHRVASPPPANNSLARLMHHRPACGLVVVCTGVNKGEQESACEPWRRWLIKGGCWRLVWHTCHFLGQRCALPIMHRITPPAPPMLAQCRAFAPS